MFLVASFCWMTFKFYSPLCGYNALTHLLGGFGIVCQSVFFTPLHAFSSWWQYWRIGVTGEWGVRKEKAGMQKGGLTAGQGAQLCTVLKQVLHL